MKRLPPRPQALPAAPPSQATASGRIVHIVVAEAVSAGIWRADVSACRAFLADRVAALATTRAYGRAARSVRVEAATHAAVYLRRFAPPEGWTSLGAEVDLGPAGRADLAWRSPRGGVLIDELKLARTGRVVGAGPTQDQARRYAAAAEGIWGAAALGVRVVLLGAPRASFLITPQLEEVLLMNTDLWFDTFSVAEAVR